MLPVSATDLGQQAYGHPQAFPLAEPQTVARPSGIRGQGSQPDGAPYITPNVSFDWEARIVLVQIRDAETGEVKRQFPAERQVEAYRRSRGGEPAPLSDLHTPGVAQSPEGQRRHPATDIYDPQVRSETA